MPAVVERRRRPGCLPKYRRRAILGLSEIHQHSGRQIFRTSAIAGLIFFTIVLVVKQATYPGESIGLPQQLQLLSKLIEVGLGQTIGNGKVAKQRCRWCLRVLREAIQVPVTGYRFKTQGFIYLQRVVQRVCLDLVITLLLKIKGCRLVQSIISSLNGIASRIDLRVLKNNRTGKRLTAIKPQCLRQTSGIFRGGVFILVVQRLPITDCPMEIANEGVAILDTKISPAALIIDNTVAIVSCVSKLDCGVICNRQIKNTAGAKQTVVADLKALAKIERLRISGARNNIYRTPRSVAAIKRALGATQNLDALGICRFKRRTDG